MEKDNRIILETISRELMMISKGSVICRENMAFRLYDTSPDMINIDYKDMCEKFEVSKNDIFKENYLLIYSENYLEIINYDKALKENRGN